MSMLSSYLCSVKTRDGFARQFKKNSESVETQKKGKRFAISNSKHQKKNKHYDNEKEKSRSERLFQTANYEIQKKSDEF